jgi:acid phosphatase
VSKLLVFVIENRSFRQMRRGMPYTIGLGRRYGYATHYHAITHPSLPNYLAIAGGSTFGIRDDDSPRDHRIQGASVFGRTLRAGRTAALYAEGMRRPCQRSDSAGGYAARHNPWTYFVGERRACRRHDVPLPKLDRAIRKGHLPNVGMVIPNICNDAHDCPLSRADHWLRRQIRGVMGGRDWRAGRLAIVVTADEDDHSQGNRILTVVAQRQLHHVVVRAPLSHYSLSKALARVGGAHPLRHGRRARSLLRVFGLRPSR